MLKSHSSYQEKCKKTPLQVRISSCIGLRVKNIYNSSNAKISQRSPDCLTNKLSLMLCWVTTAHTLVSYIHTYILKRVDGISVFNNLPINQIIGHVNIYLMLLWEVKSSFVLHRVENMNVFIIFYRNPLTKTSNVNMHQDSSHTEHANRMSWQSISRLLRYFCLWWWHHTASFELNVWTKRFV